MKSRDQRPYGMDTPLPLPVEIGPSNILRINCRAEVHMEGEHRCLVVCGIPLVWWTSGDEASESFAMVQLVRDGFAQATEVCRGFQIGRASLYRALDRFDAGGLPELVHRKRGPKGPRVLKEEATRQMRALKAKGASNVEIAGRLGVTEGAIRAALLRVGYTAPVAEQAELALASPAAVAHDDNVAADAAEQDAASPEVGPNSATLTTSEVDAATECTVAETGTDADVAGALERVQEGAAAPPAAALVPDVTPSPEAGQRTALTGVDPWNRDLDRALARAGLLHEAPPLFGACENVAGIGVLLAVPALVESGLFDVVDKVYSGWKSAFYGVRTVVLCLALMALQRIKNPEQLRHHRPPELGRALGLDRAPEVRTLRTKVAFLAAQGRSEEFVRELARRRVAARPDAIGFLYLDGHVRVYNGKTKLGKMYVTRMRLSMPATADHWINDRDGDPVLVITATPTASLAKEMKVIVKEARTVLGERRATVVFDRGGWSPKLFAWLIANGFDVLTYRKGRYPKVRLSRFEKREAEFDGRTVAYQLCERTVKLKYTGGLLEMREVVRLSDDGKHQTSIVTNRKDLADVEVAYRMFERWRQENFFKYMEAEFALDALFAYGTEECDPERMVPNPKRLAKERELREARAEMGHLERLMGAAAANNDESRRPSMRGFKIANAEVGQQHRAAREKVASLREQLTGIPARITAAAAAKGQPVVRLKTEAKRFTDSIKSVAYQAETALFRLVRAHYSRSEDEGRKLIASAFALPGDLAVKDGELRVTLQPAASPNRTRALAKLCEELNATRTTYPGTRLTLSYSIREG